MTVAGQPRIRTGVPYVARRVHPVPWGLVDARPRPVRCWPWRTSCPTCVWRISRELIVALDGRLGDPVDAYVNGSQTWLRDDGPAGEAIEWRMHPFPGYSPPDGLTHYDVFTRVARAASPGCDGPDPASLWDGLEAFPAYGDEIEPAPLTGVLTEVLGLAPDASGLVDHELIADAWERSGGTTSITTALLAQLESPAPT